MLPYAKSDGMWICACSPMLSCATPLSRPASTNMSQRSHCSALQPASSTVRRTFDDLLGPKLELEGLSSLARGVELLGTPAVLQRINPSRVSALVGG